MNKASAPHVNETPTQNVIKDALGRTRAPRYYFDWSDPVLRLFGVYSML